MIGKLGVVYKQEDNVLPPKEAKYRLCYWWFVQYFQYMDDAEDAKAGLAYHQQEDAFVERLKNK